MNIIRRSRIIASFLGAAVLPALLSGQATLECRKIHGRAHLYTGDGQLRIWHIGTHHDFEPEASSWERVQRWLEQGTTEAQKENDPLTYAGSVYLFGDFVVCPVAPYRKGAVQPARVQSVTHRHYTPAD